MILFDLFLSFMQVGAFSVGGGYAAIPLIREIAVSGHAWLTASEFSDLVTIAEMTPGPIAINAATFVGMRLGGLGGAIMATLGCIIPSLILVTLLSYLYFKNSGNRTLQTVLTLLRAVMAALIASAALNLILSAAVAEGAVFWPCAVLFAAALLLLRLKKGNPIIIMAGCGVLSGIMHALGWL